MADFKLNVTVQVAAGPALTFLDALNPEGYGLTNITVPGGSTGAGEVRVRLASDKPELLVITADKYSAKLKFTSGTGAGQRTLTLTKPLLLSGGAVDLLGDHQGELSIENSGTVGVDDAVITILSAGDVTPV